MRRKERMNPMKNKQLRLEANRQPPGSVEGDVIKRCSIVTAGEALGHGVFLDESFIAECYKQASSLKMGLKARFGHPGMCSEALGTTLGRFKNFELSDDGKQLYGDLHFAKSAKITPHGDLAAYVKQLAEDDPEAFGTSIVFHIGGYYAKDEEGEEYDIDEDQAFFSEEMVFVKCGKLLDCDFVDEPAANPNGLFSSASVAGQVEKFFSDNPEIKKLLESNKNVVDIIETYGYKLSQYLSQEKTMPIPEETQEIPPAELNSDNSDAICADSEPEAVVEEPVAAVEAAPAPEAMSASDYRKLIGEFGADIATAVFDANGSYEDALKLKAESEAAKNVELSKVITKLNAEIQSLKAQLAEFDSDGVSFQGKSSEPELTGLARARAALTKTKK